MVQLPTILSSETECTQYSEDWQGANDSHQSTGALSVEVRDFSGGLQQKPGKTTWNLKGALLGGTGSEPDAQGYVLTGY